MTNPPESSSGPADSTSQHSTQPTEPIPPTYPTQPYPPHYPGQQQYTQHYAPQPPPTYNLHQFHPNEPQQPPHGYTPAGQTPPNRGNGPGLAALILGIVAIIAAVIPIVNFLAFPLGICGLILGIVGLVIVDRPRMMAIWGTVLSVVSLVLAFVMIFVYTFGILFAVSDAVDDASRNRPVPTQGSEPSTPPATASAADILPLGTVVELTNDNGEGVYEATVSASVLDATDQVTAIEINPDPPAGMQWAMVTLDLTSIADDTVAPVVDVTAQYVASDGESYSRLDAFALAPEPTLDVLFELEPGESGTGNVVVAIPEDDPTGGIWAIKYGGLADNGGEWFYFEVE